MDLALLHAPTIAWPTVCALVRKFFTLVRSLVIVVSVLRFKFKVSAYSGFNVINTAYVFILDRALMAEPSSDTTVFADDEHSMFWRISASERCSSERTSRWGW